MLTVFHIVDCCLFVCFGCLFTFLLVVTTQYYYYYCVILTLLFSTHMKPCASARTLPPRGKVLSYWIANYLAVCVPAICTTCGAQRISHKKHCTYSVFTVPWPWVPRHKLKFFIFRYVAGPVVIVGRWKQFVIFYVWTRTRWLDRLYAPPLSWCHENWGQRNSVPLALTVTGLKRLSRREQRLC